MFILDGNGNNTGLLNHDLNEIAEAYAEFKKGKEHTSEYIFSIQKQDIKDHYNINPQHYSPKLNIALSNILDFNNRDHWSTTTIGQLEAGIKIYIGPRWNSANIKIDNPSDTSQLVPYLTASGTLELRRFTVKWLDPIKANERQKSSMEMLRVKEGDILITRSGTIGRVTYATKELAKNYIISDDLIRVRVQNENLRAYLLTYFTSQTALALMLLDEYGSVQQHLQPRHIQEMLIPIPEDWSQVQKMIDVGKKYIQAMEEMATADTYLREFGFDTII
ncbi:MAG: restriction endonuclease subunit S [Planctomycetia bacterium]|nr:restriction endonuclease subunit S [Planctomycetia bacterium]